MSIKLNIAAYQNKEVNAAPLVVFRVLFGLLMFFSTLRFAIKGWIEELYIETPFHFSYFGFDWVQAYSPVFTYGMFTLVGLSALGIAFGFRYRLAALLFFVSFTYTELMDATNYLNHYYFISLVGFSLIFLPANRMASVDCYLNPAIQRNKVPKWTVDLLKLQLGLVYFFAGLAKVNSDWLFQAEPLSLWLRSKYHLPIIGELLSKQWLAYAMSWAGCLFDLSIAFLLLNRKTRMPAYMMVVFFHLFTYMLFPIGMFPFIMIASTTIFFDPSWHEKVLVKLGLKEKKVPSFSLSMKIPAVLYVFVLFQLIWPLRHWMYSSDVLWSEEGYRFSWRVMLTDKAGVAFFTVRDASSKKQTLVDNNEFLCPRQERLMSTNPDFMLQFAHFLKEEYRKKGYGQPEVFVESYLNINGKGSRSFTDPTVDLGLEKRGFSTKSWINKPAS